MKRLLVCVAFIALCSGIVHAQGAGESPGDWLDMPVGARADAMGDAYTAVADDASAMFWNPAGLARAEGKSQLMLQYGLWLAGIGHHAVGIVVPFGASKQAAPSMSGRSIYDRLMPQNFGYGAQKTNTKAMAGGALGIGISYIASGDIPQTDSSGNPIGTGVASYNSYAAQVTYSQSMGSSLGLGITGKMINDGVLNASAMAGDVGVIFTANGNFTLGAAVQNLGGALNGTALPMIIRAGGSLGAGPLTISGEYKMGNGDPMMSAGVEFNMGGIVLRGGYVLQGITATSDGGMLSPGMSVGFGLDTSALCLDIAVVGYGAAGYDAGPLHAPTNATLTFKF